MNKDKTVKVGRPIEKVQGNEASQVHCLYIFVILGKVFFTAPLLFIDN